MMSLPWWCHCHDDVTVMMMSLSWWCHCHDDVIVMMMSWLGNTFCITALLWGESNSHCWIVPTQRNNGVELWFFDDRMNQLLNKHLLCWWFEMPHHYIIESSWGQRGKLTLFDEGQESQLCLYCWFNSSPPSAAYASVNWVSIGSGNGLLPIRHQAII